MRTLCLALSLVGALLAGCPTAPPGGDDDDAVPAAVHQYLDGTSQFTNPQGQPAPVARVLIHRVLDPADASLLEDVYQQESASSWEHFEVRGTIDPDTGEYTLGFGDSYGRLEGVGTMTEGEAWAWTAWESRSEYVDGPYVGSYVVSDDTLDDEGLEAHKQVFDPDDQLEGDVVELLDRIEEADWQSRVDGIEG